MARIHRGDTTGRDVARLLAIGVIAVSVALAVVVWLVVLVAALVVIDLGLGL